ncbi:MAG: hypothetical protein ACREBW_01400 [Candidatus Micrarchaeaceae archaeon]
MAYLSIDDFKDYSGGIDLTQLRDDDELNAILATASALCDAETNSVWNYQVLTNEPHDLTTGRSIAWETYAYYSPVRIITGAFISNSLNVSQSNFYEFPIPMGSQPGPPGLPAGSLPTNFGGIFLDRERDIVSINYTTLQFGLAGQIFPFTSFTHPQIFLSYSAGYDDGTIQSDGHSLPAPSWLREATRLIAGAMVSERNLAAQGLSAVQQVRQGQSEFRRATEGNSGSSGFTLPVEVRQLLRLHHKTSLA